MLLLRLLLLRLKNANWRTMGAAGMVLVLVALAVTVILQHIALKRAALAYKNPATKVETKTVRVRGPVRIVTKVVEVEGRKETVIEETRGPDVTVRDSSKLSIPVFPPAARPNRWLAGAALNPFSRGDREQWTAFGGYSFRNRLDLCLGVTGKGKARVLAMVRF